MAALSSLLGLVREKAPGVIDFMMLDALKDSYREFCRQSEFLRQTLTISCVAGETVALSVREGYVINLIKDVKNSGGYGLYVGKDYESPSPSKIVFSQDQQDVNAQVTLLPSSLIDIETQIDLDVIERYGDAIAAGAAKKLRLMPGETWFNPDLAAMLERQFIEGARQAFRDQEESFNSFRNRVRKREFF
ncbi:hypothetical protein [Vibrio fluvialis]|uniref:hypothetical protein n=1 Tax=Vibrio fluvialis TaxID=676 RepID=UPI001F1721AD|nr:hypothetical protein [Vibrio fluvialis]MCE7580932.1 hypothetical protein [Vibrio fluvialis]WDY54279.1 hypothetical protein PUN47_20735 [Vibrio fluvialis]